MASRLLRQAYVENTTTLVAKPPVPIAIYGDHIVVEAQMIRQLIVSSGTSLLRKALLISRPTPTKILCSEFKL